MGRKKKTPLTPINQFWRMDEVCNALSVNEFGRRHSALFRRGLRLSKTLDDLLQISKNNLKPEQVADLIHKATSLEKRRLAKVFAEGLNAFIRS